MSAKQGERYRIIAPQVGEDQRAPRVNGKEITIDKYTSTFTDAEGNQLVVVDLVGDVINASENVPYPRGANDDYRNVDWIDEYPDRFELIEEPNQTPNED